ncbi:MAG: WGR domain-containing protein [Acidobacteriota bacterium]
MKLIRQVSLQLQQGRSDKVYEVDLVETGDGQFVVNFRYGRRGTTLRDGTKTKLPVARAKADKVFDDLVSSKKAKGYVDVPVAGLTIPVVSDEDTVVDVDDPRAAAILRRLALGDTASSRFDHDRALERAGELALREALPYLDGELNLGSRLRQNVRTRALGRVIAALPEGHEAAASAIERLERLRKDEDTYPIIRHAATEALLQVLSRHDSAAFVALQAEIAALLPASLQPGTDELDVGDDRRVVLDAAGLATRVKALRKAGWDALVPLSQLAAPTSRQLLIHVLREVPGDRKMRPALKRLHKDAEFRRDAELFGVLTRRLVQGRLSPGFSPTTEAYLQRRSWRALRRLGELEDRRYVEMASGLLLALEPADATPRQRRFDTWDWRASRTITRIFHDPPFARHHAVQQVLHRWSDRFEAKRRRLGVRFREGVSPGPPREDVREEAFPDIWDDCPRALLDLLLVSRVVDVHHFATRALAPAAAFLAKIPAWDLVALLGSEHEVTVVFGFDLATTRHDPSNPDPTLLLALLDCGHEPAREKAREWIEAGLDRLLPMPAFLAGLLLVRNDEGRRLAAAIVPRRRLDEELKTETVGRVIAALTSPDNDDEGWSQSVADALFEHFTPTLGKLGLPVVRDLVAHHSAAVAGLGARILGEHAGFRSSPDDDVLQALLGSPHSSVRRLGVELLGRLDDAQLLERASLVSELVAHEREEIRRAAQPVAGRLAGLSDEFAGVLTGLALARLRERGRTEEVKADLSRLLREQLGDHLVTPEKKEILSLLRSGSAAVQELGVYLLARLPSDDVTTGEAVELASHELLAARELSWSLLSDDPQRFDRDLPQAVRWLDAKWEDSRARAAEVLREHLEGRELSPAALLSICDANREEIQQLGRDLVLRNFDEEAAEELLLKLAEHPSVSMQEFVSGLLLQHAGGRPERLRRLLSYFRVALAQVNKGRVAKERIFELFGREDFGRDEVAELVAGLMDPVSASIAVSDRAAAIELLLEVKETQPEVEVPLVVKPVEVRGGA